MNPANLPNVGGGMNGGNNNSIILSQVAQALQAQGQYSGWRAEVPVRDRAMKVYQM